MANSSVSITVGDETLQVSNLDKVLYPETGTTKRDVMKYYLKVAPALLPLVANRPVTRIRFPSGVGDGDGESTSFYEKNLPSHAPEWVTRVELPSPGSTKGRDTIVFPLLDSPADLAYLANLAALELHVPQWTVLDGVPQHPDRLVIDLDPGAPAGLGHCAAVALLVRERLATYDLDQVAPVTSGSKGMQLYAALDGSRTSEEAREIAKEIGQALTKDHPDLVVWKMTKDIRGGKVLLDYSQNTAAKTTISPYSLRGKRPRPYAAAPRTWEELERGAKTEKWLQQLSMDEVVQRLEEQGELVMRGLGRA